MKTLGEPCSYAYLKLPFVDLLIYFILDVDFAYTGQPPLFKKVDFGIDMSSRGKFYIYF